MKNKLILGTLLFGIISGGVVSASALNNQTKVEKLAELTNKSTDEIISEKYSNNKTYGEIAKENGVLEEFKDFNFEYKKQIIQERVENGELTQNEASELIAIITEKKDNCDGSGSNGHTGMGLGLGFGNGHGKGNGRYRNNN